MMIFKTRLSEVYNKVKAKLTRREREDEAETAPETTETEGLTLTATAPETSPVQTDTPVAETAPEREAGTPGDTPESSDAPAAPSRMTEEYKAWLQQQREAADAANADVNIDNVQ